MTFHSAAGTARQQSLRSGFSLHYSRAPNELSTSSPTADDKDDDDDDDIGDDDRLTASVVCDGGGSTNAAAAPRASVSSCAKAIVRRSAPCGPITCVKRALFQLSSASGVCLGKSAVSQKACAGT